MHMHIHIHMHMHMHMHIHMHTGVVWRMGTGRMGKGRRAPSSDSKYMFHWLCEGRLRVWLAGSHSGAKASFWPW